MVTRTRKSITPGILEDMHVFGAKHAETLRHLGAQLMTITLTMDFKGQRVSKQYVCIEMDAGYNPFKHFPGYPWEELWAVRRTGEKEDHLILRAVTPADFDEPM